jgi:hypothetical protein
MRASEQFRFETSVTVGCDAPPEVVFDTVADLRAHLEWSGERAKDDDFKLLTLDAPPGPAVVGTAFTSSGANFNGTFHDRSVVTEAARPDRFAIETQARLDRKRGKTWEVQFLHQYDHVHRHGAPHELRALLAAVLDTTDHPGRHPQRRHEAAREPGASRRRARERLTRAPHPTGDKMTTGIVLVVFCS